MRLVTLPSLVLLAAGNAFSAVETPFEVGTWANFCQGAVSHTFDDNTANQTGIAQPMFDAKGFHMTLFTVTNWGPDWTKLKAAFAKGHEIASHSVTHPQTMPDAECATSQATIREKVPGEPCITIAYPNCNIPNPQTELKRCYIAGRICNGQIEQKTPSDFYRIGALMAGSAGTNTADGLNNKANEAAASGGWLVWCHHGVGNDGHGYSNTATDALQANVDFLDRNRDKIWTESFGNVARYIRERDAAALSVTSSDDKSITVSLTDNLPDSIYNYPLSIRRPLPDGWTKAAVTQKGTAVEDTVVTVNSKQYVMFRAVPDGGDVVISSGVVAVNTRFLNLGIDNAAPVHWRHSALIIDAQQFNGSTDIVVSFFDLHGRIIDRKKFESGASVISVPTVTFDKTAFIVKVSGGGRAFVGKFIPQS